MKGCESFICLQLKSWPSEEAMTFRGLACGASALPKETLSVEEVLMTVIFIPDEYLGHNV